MSRKQQIDMDIMALVSVSTISFQILITPNVSLEEGTETKTYDEYFIHNTLDR